MKTRYANRMVYMKSSVRDTREMVKKSDINTNGVPQEERENAAKSEILPTQTTKEGIKIKSSQSCGE